MPRHLLALAVFALAACQPANLPGPAEAAPGAGLAGSYRLATLNGAALRGGATLLWEGDGRLSGEAPCNAWFARQGAQAPAFRLTDLGTTRRACLWMGDEGAFFAALAAVTEVAADAHGLTLRGPGTEMRFTR